MTDHADLPDTGAVLTFGRSRFNENQASRFWIKSDPIIACACGDEHTVVIAESRRVFAFGSNEFGQLGLGHNKSVTRPSCIKALKSEQCSTVGCGKSHTVIGTEDGKLFAFGLNQDGQLGLGHTETTFDQVTAWSEGTAVQLAAGVAHSVALTDDGSLFAWGSNEDGQCGLGDAPGACLPQQVPSDGEIVNLSCGYRHTAFVTAAGELYTFGENDEGQLGLGDRENRTRPTRVPGLGPVITVACGGQHTLVLTESGEVWCFGGGGQGQLGLGSRLLTALTPQALSLGQIRARDVAAGHCHSAIVTDDHQLLTFGDSRHGKLCAGEEESNVFIPQPATQLEQLHVNKAVLGGCQTMVLVGGRTSPGRRSASELISNGLPTPTDDVHSSARQRRREREMTLSGRGRTLPPLKGTTPRPQQSPQQAESAIQPGSAREPSAAGDNGERRSPSPLDEHRDEQSVPSSGITQEESADVDDVKTVKKKEGGKLSKLMNRFKRKKPETIEKDKTDSGEAEKTPAESQNQPEGLIQRVIPVASADADTEEGRPSNPSPDSDQQGSPRARTPPPTQPAAPDDTAPGDQPPAEGQKDAEEQDKKKKKKQKASSKTCVIV